MFLREVAKELLKRFGHNMSNVTVVFPGKRARLFMNQYLAEESECPVWAPQYKTIDELYSELSPYRKADTIMTVCELYRIYASIVPDAEPLDEFYNWGEIILSDFDDIDKHMAPAEKIFHNVHDLQSITTDYLTEEQEEALRKFFKNFSKESNSHIKEQFLRLWDIMPDLYTRLNETLRSQGQLYSGALYREVSERLKAGEEIDTHDNILAFVGFNILDDCEEALLRYYHNRKRALFFWDYDKLYTQDALWEAGYFISQNLRKFPNALPEEMFDNLRHLKDITFVATSTNNAQCRYIPNWLETRVRQNTAEAGEKENETAIVLADEHLLGSVLHSIPAHTPNIINVTMGFPLVDTPVYSFVNVLMSMFIDGYEKASHSYRYTFMEKVRRHPFYHYIKDVADLSAQEPDCQVMLDKLLRILDAVSLHFGAKQKPDIYDQLYTEAIFQCHLILSRFKQLTMKEAQAEATLAINPSTLRRLLKQVFMSTSIPFHGEPAIGMQIMGLLETRNIDFKNLLMLSVGEGILPKKSDDNSLIPYSLRESFGLTTIRHKISVFAYYFYRLVSHAEHVTLVYNENSSGATSNEMSRFMRQLMAETDLPIKHVKLMPSNQRPDETESRCVAKSDEMIKMLREKYINQKDHTLSPTAINTYLSCKLQFYYKYVAGMRVKENIKDGITPALFGTIFHDAAEMFYRHLTKQYGTTNINAAMLEQKLADKTLCIDPFIDASLIINYFKPIDDNEKKEAEIEKITSLSSQQIREYAAKFYKKPQNELLLTGINHIIHKVLLQYLHQLVEHDHVHAPFTIEALEKDFFFSLKIGEGEEVQTGGRIDRLERDKNGKLVVLDYKTGGKMEPVNGVNAIFEHKTKICSYFLQTFTYALCVQEKYKGDDVQPTLFYINKAGKPEEYDRTLQMGTDKKRTPITDIATYQEEFMTKLQETVKGIFSKEIPFESTQNRKSCADCDFTQLCGIKIKETKEN